MRMVRTLSYYNPRVLVLLVCLIRGPERVGTLSVDLGINDFLTRSDQTLISDKRISDLTLSRIHIIGCPLDFFYFLQYPLFPDLIFFSLPCAQVIHTFLHHGS